MTVISLTERRDERLREREQQNAQNYEVRDVRMLSLQEAGLMFNNSREMSEIYYNMSAVDSKSTRGLAAQAQEVLDTAAASGPPSDLDVMKRKQDARKRVTLAAIATAQRLVTTLFNGYMAEINGEAWETPKDLGINHDEPIAQLVFEDLEELMDVMPEIWNRLK